MEPFNITVMTVEDGALVSTRKGIRVKKEKHGKLAFINTSTNNICPPRTPIAKSKITQSSDLIVMPISGPRRTRPKSPRAKANKTKDNSSGPEKEPEVDRISRIIKQLALPPRLLQRLETLPASSKYQVPAHLSPVGQRHLLWSMVMCPELSYPLDKYGIMTHNPMLASDRSEWMTASHFILTTNLLLGAAFEARREGKRESRALRELHAKTYRYVSHQLKEPGERSDIEYGFLVMSVAGLAFTASLVGNDAQWKIHAKGMQVLISASGGLGKLDPITLNCVRGVDIDCAIPAGAQPHIPFFRRHYPFTHVLPAAEIDAMFSRLRTRLSVCSVDPNVIETLISVFTLKQSTYYARTATPAIKFGPEELMEEIWFLKFQLQSSPKPLFKQPKDQSTSVTESLESALRIAALMYFDKRLLDSPIGWRYYSKLLYLIVKPMETLLDAVHAGNMRRLPIDQVIASARPFLLWICMLGHLFSVRTGVYPSGASYRDFGSSIYRRMVRKLVGTQLESADAGDLALAAMTADTCPGGKAR
ncbi:uncharacterized protein BCR38DRAFT_482491 [Pseudomassariella vexata]|uniref:Uncharacterized protein n=1 Tax=Pseudomassariella vexata TaxID=1141098 RepID=A0A1Y2EDZ9_9PEZI|nr:uncharacterized protein BCR38DRAFT_482491 [Pseudomassariella vexata]ORY69015.1 hypothetical protein BCR38DRAFT_482491 [Pseudomassariella vexata]